MTDKLPVYIDTETTGLNPAVGHELLEIAIVEEGGTVLLNTLVKPLFETEWPEAMAVNNITPEMVKDAPRLADLDDQIIDAIIGRTVYIWNADFDKQFIGWALEYADQVVCAMTEFGEFINRTQPQNKSSSGRYKMARVAEDLRIENEQEHRALGDVLTMIQIRQTYLAPGFNRTDLTGNLKTPAYKE